MDNIFEEDKYLSKWYDWEEIREYSKDYKEEISPEEIVAINNGFGITKAMTSLVGKIEWNKTQKRFEYPNVKVEKSKRINFYGDDKTGLYKITDLGSPTNQYHKILMSLDTNQKLYSTIEKYKEFKLDDTNYPIYSFNERFGLRLTENKHIENYILFFFFSVKGRHGRFYPLSTDIGLIPDQINNFLRFSMGCELKDYYSARAGKLNAIIGNMKIKSGGKTDENQGKKPPIKIDDLFIIFKDSLFSSKAEVDAEGKVSLQDEEPLEEDLLSIPTTN